MAPRGQKPPTSASVPVVRPNHPCSWGRRPADYPGGAVPRGTDGAPEVFPARGAVLTGLRGGAET